MAARTPDLVLVPGFMQRREAWRAVAEIVAPRYAVRRLDLEEPDLEGRLVEIARATPPGAALAGYSMGGRLALHLAARDPGRLGALILVGASAGIEDPSERAARRRLDAELAAWIERHPIEEVVARWERSPVFETQPDALRDSQRPDRLSHDPAALGAVLRSAGQGALAPIWDRLERIECPVLAVAGERDPAYAAAARRIATLVPRGESRLVRGAGHAPQLEQPEQVAGLLLEFLDEHLGERGIIDDDAEAGPLGNG